MPSYVTGKPAFGRDYKTKKAVLEAWYCGHDFQDARSLQYFNKDSFLNEDDVIMVELRYKNLEQVTLVKATSKGSR